MLLKNGKTTKNQSKNENLTSKVKKEKKNQRKKGLMDKSEAVFCTFCSSGQK